MAKKRKPIFDGDDNHIGPYLRELADQMGLRDWTIQVMDGAPDNPQHAACVEIRYGRKWANVWFHPEWAQERPESFRTTCVHELLHCHLKPVQWALNNVETLLGSTAFGILSASHDDAMEVAIDAIASEWSKHLPLPVKVKGTT